MDFVIYYKAPVIFLENGEMWILGLSLFLLSIFPSIGQNLVSAYCNRLYILAFS